MTHDAITPISEIAATELHTGADGLARWRKRIIALPEGSPLTRLTPLASSGGWQLRRSPADFKSDFHCTTDPQWLVVLTGRMEIGLRDGSARTFGPGEFFYSNDTLPAGVAFDAALHGHRSRAVGDQPLVTLFVRAVLVL
ncbi:MAG: hypothetical protein LBH31_07395 [Burkholderiaceae bacterium]|nr:hypothetical protein [Burkholderiaceae bacterium]